MSARERVHALIETAVPMLNPDATFETVDDGEVISVAIEGEELGQIIGRHGQTLDALQHLASRAAALEEDGRRRVEVDAGGWRVRRAEELYVVADEAADRAVDTGERVALPAMSASERRVVHEYLREREDVDTASEGREPERRLVVEPFTD